jgi:DNA end-binding protein Ku
MRFKSELRTPSDVGLPSAVRAPAERRQEMERALAELTEKQLDLKLLEDEYAGALRELAEAKRDADRDVVEIEETPPEDAEESAEIIDIMAVLRERMGGAARKPARAAEPGLEDKSKKELYERAKELGLEGRSSMSREELIAALRKAG